MSAVEQLVFGTAEPDQIADTVDAFCRHSLGSQAVEGLFYRSSVGCVIGLGLGNGERVVLKAYQSRWPQEFLDAVGTRAAPSGRVGVLLRHPAATGRTVARAPQSGHHRELAGRSGHGGRSWATGPADLGRRPGPPDRPVPPPGPTRRVAGPPPRAPTSGLYPEPHSPLFDFEATAEGAEWIDAIAIRAKAQREADDGPLVIAHLDWCARNVRITDHLAAVYDWDSLAWVSESTAVGQAAATWAVTSEEGGTDFPAVDELASYVQDYEAAVGRRFTAAQWSGAAGAAAWILAYIARCEHSLAVSGRARPDQCGASDRLGSEAEAIMGLAERVASD